MASPLPAMTPAASRTLLPELVSSQVAQEAGQESVRTLSPVQTKMLGYTRLDSTSPSPCQRRGGPSRSSRDNPPSHRRLPQQDDSAHALGR
ncbi:hypothetical protein AAL_07371 [Moelleriella libera RCEF 2490]|uniref:Uncharacterized protein n=1 Tax=Moelleriella libera RCEF 2490 TaxID=1081109 RepID=A0A166NIL7_9HYPO|nr:hypothetical protein AAL_07371 [Moelleriella libera RCEF 2490]